MKENIYMCIFCIFVIDTVHYQPNEK
ncbi:erythromycin resistance leader peptide [Dolosicoccus paucivorans]